MPIKSARPLTLLLATALPLPAVEFTDLAGDWSIADLCVPAALQEEYYDIVTTSTRLAPNSCATPGINEILQDVYYAEAHATELRSMSFSPTGAVTGQETGQALSISQNRMIYSDGMDPIAVYSNTTGDILLTSERTTELLEQSILLKKPTTLTTAELQGAWFIVDMINPNDLTKTYGGGNLTDVRYEADSSMVSGDINIDAAGNFTGLFSGTITATGPGDADVNAGGIIPFKSNAAKNIAIATPGDADESEYIILVKKPTTLTTAELSGTWRVSALRIPTTLTKSLYDNVAFTTRDVDSDVFPNGNEFVTGTLHEEKFDLVRLQLQVAADGTLPNGSFVANPAAKTVTFNYDGDTVLAHPNADLTFMVGTVIEPDSHELIVFIKTADTAPTTFEETTDLQTITSGSELLLNWNSTSGTVLQESSLLSGWTTVEEATGDTYTADTTTVGTRFFRVAELP